jgi:hypothetical protein
VGSPATAASACFSVDSLQVDSLDSLDCYCRIFTWETDSSVTSNREIDILEMSRWGIATDPANAQYVLQPFKLDGHRQRFSLNTTAPITCVMTWTSTAVSLCKMTIMIACQCFLWCTDSSVDAQVYTSVYADCAGIFCNTEWID